MFWYEDLTKREPSPIVALVLLRGYQSLNIVKYNQIWVVITPFNQSEKCIIIYNLNLVSFNKIQKFISLSLHKQFFSLFFCISLFSYFSHFT